MDEEERDIPYFALFHFIMKNEKNNMKYFFMVFTLTVLLLSSCANNLVIDRAQILSFPPPPDTARIQFLTSFSNSVDITGKQSDFMKYVFGEDKTEEIKKPYGISILNNIIYTVDIAQNAIIYMDLKEKLYDTFVPEGLGQLKNPISCFVDKDTVLYVADSKRGQILAYDKDLNYLNSFGADSMVAFDICVNKDKIYVPDYKNHKVHVFSKNNYKILFSFPDSEVGSEDFLFSPTFIAIQNNMIYVTDFGSFNIKKYSLTGEYISTIGSYGKMIGQFIRPKGIAVDNDGILYVVDMGFENVQMFDSEDKLLMFFGGAYQGRGYMYMPAEICIDYNNLEYFSKYVYGGYKLKYLIYVTNQFGPEKISVYGFVDPIENNNKDSGNK